jgi:hypothetical protein
MRAGSEECAAVLTRLVMGTSVGQQRDKAVKRWFSDPAAPPDASLDESLRQVGADLLGEPIPESLLQALCGTECEAEGARPAPS